MAEFKLRVPEKRDQTTLMLAPALARRVDGLAGKAGAGVSRSDAIDALLTFALDELKDRAAARVPPPRGRLPRRGFRAPHRPRPKRR